MTSSMPYTVRILAIGAAFLVCCVHASTAVSSVAKEDGKQRMLLRETTVDAPRHEVWLAWTTADGIRSFFAPKANIDLRVGGAYEILIVPDAPKGDRGSEGCRVLSYLPDEMLSFEWNFPPTIPTLRKSGAKTHVVLRFDQLASGQTRLRLAHLGWQEGEDWNAGYAYFDSAWGHVLDRLRDRFAPVETDSHDGASETSESWIDNRVTVTSISKPERRQDFEVDLPVPVSRAWHAMTTREGLQSFIAPDPRIELRVGGTFEIHEGTDSRVQAFVPHEMLAVTGSAPLEFPNVRMGGTWAMITFESTGYTSCRVRMSVTGWREGDEWDRAFEYFLKNNAVFLNLLHERFTKGPLEWKKLEGNAHSTYTRLPLSEDTLGTLPTDTSVQREDKVFMLDAALSDVWAAFTTEKGLSAWTKAPGKVELRLGGPFTINLHTDGAAVAGKGDLEGSKLLSFVPHRMLAYEGDSLSLAPTDGSASRMWTVWRFEPVAPKQVRVRFSVLGSCSAETWARGRAASGDHLDRAVHSLRRYLAGSEKP